jgi:hypothetical protein
VGRPRRHSRKLAVFSDAKALADSLPEHLSNPNGVDNWTTLDDHRRAVADFLRTEGVSASLAEQLAPDVSAATGLPLCILIRNRLTGVTCTN